MKISKAELNNNYGINLPTGKYRIKIDNDSYIINTVKDDTEGCILVGENKKVGQVLNSTSYEQRLTKLIKEATSRGEQCFITII